MRIKEGKEKSLTVYLPAHPPCHLPMSKRNAADSRLARKRRKEGVSHAVVDLDAMTGRSERVEPIRVWNITTSGTTGRVSGTRKILNHVYESSPGPSREESREESHEESPFVGDIGTPAETEPSVPLPKKSTTKRRRVRVAKENDSVSLMPTSSTKLTKARPQTKMQAWLAFCMVVLDELLRRDGLGDSTDPRACVSCKKRVGEYRCIDCLGGYLHCSACIVSLHSRLPFHRTQVRPIVFMTPRPPHRPFISRFGWTDFSNVSPSRAWV